MSVPALPLLPPDLRAAPRPGTSLIVGRLRGVTRAFDTPPPLLSPGGGGTPRFETSRPMDAPVTWRTTAPDSELDYRCDLCNEKASTIHFLPWVIRCERVLFACPKHDPGGYWTDLPLSDRMFRHIEGKPGSTDALMHYGARIDALRVIA